MLKVRRCFTAIGASALLAVLVGPITSNAFAGTVFVSNTAPLSASGGSCEAPQYATIQGAVDAVSPGTSIKVCPGAYAEQLVIEKSVKIGGADPATPPTVAAPAAVAHPTGPCATGPADDIEVMVCAASPVSLSNLRIDARFSETDCSVKLYGVLVGGGATLTAKQDQVLGASPSASGFCSSGIGIGVGTTGAVEQAGHATLREVSVGDYRARGIAAAGAGSSVSVVDSDVLANAASQFAPTGVEIGNGATGSVRGSTVARNSHFGRVLGIGILVDRATPPVVIARDTLEEDGIGVRFVSGATTEPSTPELSVRRSLIRNSDYAGLLLEQGTAQIGHDILEGGELGIQIRQAGSQPFASHATAAYDTISGTQAAVDVLSDHFPSDPPGDFLIKRSAISNNAAEVINESSTFTVTKVHDT